jgi:ribosomal protein S6--L-glutamate ligase
MLDLALTTNAETARRITDPLADRDITVQYLRTTGRSFPLDGSAPIAGTDGSTDSDPPIETADFDVGLVYPSRFMEGGVLDAVCEFPWVNPRRAVALSRNKAGVVATLARANLPVPDSTLVSNPADESLLCGVFERFDGPVVVKPNSATRGIGITTAHDFDSFYGICEYLGLLHEFPTTGDKSFLVQEFLPDARDYRVMVLDGECVGAVERRGPGWKHNVHRGARATGITPPAEIATLAREVADVLSIRYLGVDVLATDEGAFVTETNARPTIDEASKYETGFYDALAALIRRTATGN